MPLCTNDATSKSDRPHKSNRNVGAQQAGMRQTQATAQGTQHTWQQCRPAYIVCQQEPLHGHEKPTWHDTCPQMQKVRHKPRTTVHKTALPTGSEYTNKHATNNATSKSNTQRMPSIKLWMHIKQACARLGNCSMATNAQQQPLAQPTNGHQAHEQRPKHRG